MKSTYKILNIYLDGQPLPECVPKIITTKNSYAEQYAIDNNISYEYEGRHDWLNN